MSEKFSLLILTVCRGRARKPVNPTLLQAVIETWWKNQSVQQEQTLSHSGTLHLYLGVMVTVARHAEHRL
jgi:hypothetical protein